MSEVNLDEGVYNVDKDGNPIIGDYKYPDPKPPYLIKRGTSKKEISSYFGYTDILWQRGDMIAMYDLPGKHAQNKDPKWMKKNEIVKIAKEKYGADLDPKWGIERMRGELRKLKLKAESAAREKAAKEAKAADNED